MFKWLKKIIDRLEFDYVPPPNYNELTEAQKHQIERAVHKYPKVIGRVATLEHVEQLHGEKGVKYAEMLMSVKYWEDGKGELR